MRLRMPSANTLRAGARSKTSPKEPYRLTDRARASVRRSIEGSVIQHATREAARRSCPRNAGLRVHPRAAPGFIPIDTFVVREFPIKLAARPVVVADFIHGEGVV